MNLKDLSEEHLITHTETYAKNVIQTFNDICGASFSISSKPNHNTDEIVESGVTIFTYFTGTIQGIYSLSLTAEIAKKILGIESEETSIEDLAAGLFEEIVNVATGESIEELKEQFGFLTFNPPVIVYGESKFPRYRNCYTEIISEHGVATVRFSINMASLEITDQLLNTLKKLKKQQSKNFMDSLTDIYNRTYYDYYKSKLFGRRKPLAFVIFDVDKFKDINDHYGHSTGDKALQHIAETLKKNVRDTDYPIRYGGDEFVVLLEESPLIGAKRLMVRVMNQLVTQPLTIDDRVLPITVSVGITEYHEGEDFDTMFLRADKNLYKSKENGRNQISEDAD